MAASVKSFQNSTSGIYAWTFTGAPVTIRIGFDVISRINADLDRMADGTLCHGALFGRSESSSSGPVNVDICDYRMIRRDPACGLYAFTAEELRHLQTEFQGDTQIVGYFRTHTGEAPDVCSEDVDIVKRKDIPVPDVILLIAMSDKERVAGFLFRENDWIMPCSFFDFPFEVERLQREQEAKRKRAKAVQMDEPEPAAAPVPAPAPAVETPLQPPPIVRKRPRPVMTSAVPRRKALMIGAALMLVVLTGAIVMLRRKSPSKPASTTTTASLPSAPFQLAIDSQSDGLNIRWNSASPAILRALAGRLIITEPAAAPRIIDLTSQQLRFGKVFFESTSNRVQIQLEASDGVNSVVGEAILALRSPTGVRTSSPVRQAMTHGRDDRAAPVTTSRSSAREAPPAAANPSPSGLMTAIRTFIAPPQRPNAPPVPHNPVLVEPPPAVLASSQVAAVVATPNPLLQAYAAHGIPPPVTAPTRLSMAREQQIPPVKSKPAVAVFRPTPVLTESIRSLLTKDIDVRVDVQVDTTGRVVKAQLADRAFAGTQFEQLVITTAKRWRFQPATVRDRPVPSEHEIRFRFPKATL
jgi:TonB family protein